MQGRLEWAVQRRLAAAARAPHLQPKISMSLPSGLPTGDASTAQTGAAGAAGHDRSCVPLGPDAPTTEHEPEAKASTRADGAVTSTVSKDSDLSPEVLLLEIREQEYNRVHEAFWTGVSLPCELCDTSTGKLPCTIRTVIAVRALGSFHYHDEVCTCAASPFDKGDRLLLLAAAEQAYRTAVALSRSIRPADHNPKDMGVCLPRCSLLRSLICDHQALLVVGATLSSTSTFSWRAAGANQFSRGRYLSSSAPGSSSVHMNLASQRLSAAVSVPKWP